MYRSVSDRIFLGRGFFAFSFGAFRSDGSRADFLCGRTGAFDETGCVRRFSERGEGRHADGDRNCADLNRADGGGRRAAVIGISGGIWKTAWNRAGTGGNPVCAGTARCCASLFQQRGGGLLLDLYKEAGCDSFAGRAASIMMSCTETVFYTMAVYFGAVQIKKTRYTLAGALFSSLVGMAVSIALAKGV